MKNMTLKDINYPAKYVGTKPDGSKKCVYTYDGNMGLVFKNKGPKEPEFHWEYFELIELYEK